MALDISIWYSAHSSDGSHLRSRRLHAIHVGFGGGVDASTITADRDKSHNQLARHGPAWAEFTL